MTPREPPPPETIERQQWLEEKRKEVEEESASGLRHLLPGSGAAAHASEWERRHWTSRVLHRMGDVAGHPIAGIVATTFVVLWVVVGVVSGFPTWWQVVLYSVSGCVTIVMVFVIQHAQQRLTSATQRKLDELIRSSALADNSLIAVEEAAEEHLHALTHLNLADRNRASGMDGE